jgi:hypothetical protein
MTDVRLSPQQDEWVEEHHLRHSWQGERRPWIYGEPCPAQMRDRLAPEWRHFDAKGNPHYENAVGLPTDGQDESPRVGAATARRADRRLVRPPYVHVKRTKTAGWQVLYVPKTGKPVIRKRQQEFGEALTSGTALARIHECPVEVDR